MRTRVLVGAALIAVAAWGCGGSSNPASPTQSTAGGGGGNATTIDILANDGNLSFDPNPATAAQGSSVVFVNTHDESHHIVANDGSFDTGVLAPGANARITVTTNGANYHCTIHPTMIGSINASSGTPPACTGPYC